jgi:hypothetical protein
LCAGSEWGYKERHDFDLANKALVGLLGPRKAVDKEWKPGFMVQRLRKTWTKHHIISGKNTGFTTKKSTAEPILKLRTCLDNAHKYKRPLYPNGEDLSKAFDTP